MRMKYLLFLVLTSYMTSCTRSQPEPNPETTDSDREPIPFLKDSILLDQGRYCIMETPLIYEDYLLIMTTNWDTREGWINCYDKDSLELKWRWQEALDEFGAPAKGFGSVSYVHDGILAIAQSNLSYGIDIQTGQTIWKNRDIDSAASAIFGNKNTIANTRIVDSKTHRTIISADISNGIWNTNFEFMKNDTLDVGLGTPLPFTWNEKEYLTFVSTKWTSSAQTRINKLNLYNQTDGILEWTSDTIPLYQPLSGKPGVQPEFEDGQIILGNDALYSYNVEDGSLEWWEWYGNSFVSSGSHLTTADGIVYANNASQFLVGIDVHTGEEIINTITGGTPSPVEFHNGKCYMSSLTVGGTNRLMIIDGLTGEILQNVKAPFRSEDRDWTFERAIAVDPETGLVYTADHKYLLVYDFED